MCVETNDLTLTHVNSFGCRYQFVLIYRRLPNLTHCCSSEGPRTPACDTIK